ncbi:3-beta-hydroxysteroid-Delta(8), Delta(7)-isomerase 2 [Pleurostoma richardsiae]|uniref:3-beta-hydroxysteroid-Delta(8), Delta(7)-isomerase 2 n=1 Tax=Pleurostoma richardsiae TaxID=41990 RepID=A0AA38RL86_9PEZI|nr:3-beta-hydroxysteroid-Delta(8), Delta(7)-isomerase 2 [Pleurostoma richardsiae]
MAEGSVGMIFSTNGSTAHHPYYPLDAVVPGYVANSISTPALIASFAAGCTVILSSACRLVQKKNPSLPRGEVAAALWFILCGFIHFFFEGYFAYNFHRTGSRTDLFGQLWKEYSLSDSRYMTQDAFIVCMETITAVFWGPLSFVCAYAIVVDHPVRYSLQSIVSLGQLYGDVLYYATNQYERAMTELVFCRPEGVYFWAYYVMMNAFWIVIPLLLVIQSTRQTARLASKLKEVERATRKKNR